MEYERAYNDHIIPESFIDVILKDDFSVRNELKLFVLEFSIEKQVNVRKVDADSNGLQNGTCT